EMTRGRIGKMLKQARTTAADERADEKDRLAVLPLLGREAKKRDGDLKLLSSLLVPQNSSALQSAAVVALGRIKDGHVSELMTTGWNTHTPALKGQILDLLLS